MLIRSFNLIKSIEAEDPRHILLIRILDRLFAGCPFETLEESYYPLEEVDKGLPLEIPSVAKLSIDRIALSIPRELLNHEKAKETRCSNILNIINLKGQTYLIVHAEYKPELTFHSLRMFSGLLDMAKKGVFESKIATLIKIAALVLRENSFGSAIRATHFMRQFFEWTELEIAMDFYHFPLVDLASAEKFNYKGKTLYTKDYLKEEREQDGKTEKWRTQYSALTIYQHDEVHPEDKYPTDRMEFLFSGRRYKKDLFYPFLSLTTQQLFKNLLPDMGRITKNLISRDSLRFQPTWLLQSSLWWFRDFLIHSDWFGKKKTTENRRNQKNIANRRGSFNFLLLPNIYYNNYKYK